MILNVFVDFMLIIPVNESAHNVEKAFWIFELIPAPVSEFISKDSQIKENSDEYDTQQEWNE